MISFEWMKKKGGLYGKFINLFDISKKGRTLAHSKLTGNADY
jgi:hypothetical protein